MAYKMFLDCDPGLDDALALLLAHGDPEIDLVAVTAVSGNVGLADTMRNALSLREFLGFPGVEVAAGAAAPLLRQPLHVPHLHGEGGLGALSLPAPRLPPSPRHASDLLIETLRANPGAVHLVATGPLTNIALALAKDPGIAELVASFTVMGGSFSRGNVTPAAEFNIFVDPEAAKIVFAAGWEVTMVGLDLTRQARATPTVLTRFTELGDLGKELVVPLATYLAKHDSVDGGGQILHDVCAVAYVSRPDLFSSRRAGVDVETAGTLTAGMTVVDFRSTRPNAVVPTTLDTDGFWDYVTGCYANVAARFPADGLSPA
ncbi:nucleoside hydrolase [Streptomyces sp. NPDC091272]|uniref:nucleoside hydrolase n=1 Tax=Streptomyces sp. NPDC091272 TaxID=3365981 RepID=UPI00382549D5